MKRFASFRSSAALAFDERPIDLAHLARTTLGDPSLEGEMLVAFGFKASMLILRMQQAARSSICAAARALRGSARGIGAWRVASAAETVELAAESGAEPELKSAVDQLGVVAEETRAAIAELLQANYCSPTFSTGGENQRFSGVEASKK